MFGFIYLTTNCINQKRYIGQTIRPPTQNYFGSGSVFLQALKKYGKRNFVRTIVCFCDTQEELDAKEKELIALWNPEYNIHEGGSEGNWMKYATDEQKAARSKKAADSNRGKKRSVEARMRMSAAKKGVPGPKRSEETKRKIGDWHRGQKRSAETRKKMSDAKKGKVFTAEHKRKLSEVQIGKKRGPHSEETRRKISEKAIRRNERNRENQILYYLYLAA